MKRDFEGITGRAQAGISSRGDSGQRLITLTAGHNFAGDHGNITLAWEHGEEDRLDVRQRGYLSGSARIGFYKNPADTEAGTDSNNDGIPDAWEIAQGLDSDCNGNNIIDRCEIAAAPALAAPIMH